MFLLTFLLLTLPDTPNFFAGTTPNTIHTDSSILRRWRLVCPAGTPESACARQGLCALGWRAADRRALSVPAAPLGSVPTASSSFAGLLVPVLTLLPLVLFYLLSEKLGLVIFMPRGNAECVTVGRVLRGNEDGLFCGGG